MIMLFEPNDDKVLTVDEEVEFIDTYSKIVFDIESDDELSLTDQD